jgi:hypothetical protein
VPEKTRGSRSPKILLCSLCQPTQSLNTTKALNGTTRNEKTEWNGTESATRADQVSHLQTHPQRKHRQADTRHARQVKVPPRKIGQTGKQGPCLIFKRQVGINGGRTLQPKHQTVGGLLVEWLREMEWIPEVRDRYV